MHELSRLQPVGLQHFLKPKGSPTGEPFSLEVTVAESSLWRLAKKHLSAYGHIVRVENPVGPGTPDVHYCLMKKAGWIELKAIKAWPKRKTTPVRIRHYSVEQRLWHKQYGETGGRMFILVRIDETKEYFLFDWDWAHRNLGSVTRAHWYKNAVVSGKSRFPTAEILKALTK